MLLEQWCLKEKLCFELKHPNMNLDEYSNRKTGKKTLWYNRSYAYNVKKNIGKAFFKLLKKHLLKSRRFSKHLIRILSNLASAI